MLNKELLERIEKLELHKETLIEINEKYSNTIGKLRARLKELIVK
jgi:chaperonin cofactor prefoldin